jgi:hypothetical protein
MKRPGLWAIVLIALPAQAQAQATARPSLGIGYSLLRELGDFPATYRAGWTIDLATAPRPVISWVAEAGANYRSPAGVRQTLSSYQGGVRVTPLTGRLTGFLQALVGLERFAEPGFHEHGLTLQPGGGVDVEVTRRYAVRGQLDYRVVRVRSAPGIAAATFKELRAAFGIAIRIGN